MAIVIAVAVTGCGTGSTSSMDGQVRKAVVSLSGKDDVASVSCTGKPPSTSSDPTGGTGPADDTCAVRFTDGQAAQVWAVRKLDVVVGDEAQLLYRVDKGAQPQAPTVDVERAFSSQMAILDGGPVAGVTCRSMAPGTSAAQPQADHVCVARVPGQGRQRWAVRVLGSNVQLLGQLG